MSRHSFSPPVYARSDQPSVRVGISHIEGAAEELMKWTNRGPRWGLAVRICTAALADKVSPQMAAKAFLAAAKEEGTSLPPMATRRPVAHEKTTDAQQRLHIQEKNRPLRVLNPRGPTSFPITCVGRQACAALNFLYGSPLVQPSVYVRTDRPGIRYGVSHVEGAAEELMKWTKRGPKWTLVLHRRLSGPSVTRRRR
ncbi:DUF982 domain-containing protein [Mesorhizobium sp. M0768]|uniref:DUF982 domain-containing protein n=1 Tax=Mesorhizobium sp. M0768 TaxID=2956996 RepID=UPI003337212D